MNWFPREYLALVGLAMWGATMMSIYGIVNWIARRNEKREALTAAPESHPKSAE